MRAVGLLSVSQALTRTLKEGETRKVLVNIIAHMWNSYGMPVPQALKDLFAKCS